MTFISFPFLIAIPRTFKSMLNKSGESVHPYLVSDLRGNAFSYLPLSMMLPVNLLYMSIMLEYVSSVPTSWRVCTINGCRILSKTCSACIEIHLFIYSLICLCGVSHWSVDIKKSLHSSDQSHLIMVYDPFNMLLALFAIILLRIFASYVHQ